MKQLSLRIQGQNEEGWLFGVVFIVYRHGDNPGCLRALPVVLVHDQLQHPNPSLEYTIKGETPKIKAHIKQKGSQIFFGLVKMWRGTGSRQDDPNNMNKSSMRKKECERI